MVTLLAHIKVVPGTEARFERIAAELHRRTHADEADVRRYEYWRGDEPSTYYCLESFPDLLGFLAHQTSDHHEAAGPKYQGIIESMRLEWVDPLGTASPLTPTNTAPLPDGASELTARYYERFAAVEAQWWQPLRDVTDTSQEA